MLEDTEHQHFRQLFNQRVCVARIVDIKRCNATCPLPAKRLLGRPLKNQCNLR